VTKRTLHLVFLRAIQAEGVALAAPLDDRLIGFQDPNGPTGTMLLPAASERNRKTSAFEKIVQLIPNRSVPVVVHLLRASNRRRRGT